LTGGAIEQAGIIQREITSPVIRQSAGQKTLDDFERFRKPFVTLASAGPAFAHDVFVQAFPCPEPEGEAVVAEQRNCSRALGNDRRVIAHDRTSDRGHQADLLGCIGQCSEDRPGERRVALLLDPWEEVIGNSGEIKAGLLGTIGIAHQIGRAVLL
jgi:hypothetical protein